MKLVAKDLKHLKWAITLMVAMVLTGIGALWSTQQREKSSELALRENSAARNDIRTRLAQARDEQAELNHKIGHLREIEARGLIGAEQRLDWVEAIAHIKAVRGIGKLDYHFSPQRGLDATILPGGTAAGGLEIMASQMQLQAELLHEGELLGFLADISSAVNALVKVRSCSMERIPAATASQVGSAQLKADCTLEWITLKSRK